MCAAAAARPERRARRPSPPRARFCWKRGPDAVTLKAVAAEIGMTHTNLLHHFGSAEELQSALMSKMVRDLNAALGDAVAHLRSKEGAPRALVDMVFDAFDKGGAGQLAAWIALSGKQTQLEPIQQAVDELVNAIEDKFAGHSPRPIRA